MIFISCHPHIRPAHQSVNKTFGKSNLWLSIVIVISMKNPWPSHANRLDYCKLLRNNYMQSHAQVHAVTVLRHMQSQVHAVTVLRHMHSQVHAVTVLRHMHSQVQWRSCIEAGPHMHSEFSPAHACMNSCTNLQDDSNILDIKIKVTLYN